MSKPCIRCDGDGQLPIDRAEPVPPEWCHRCEGNCVEPGWAASAEVRRPLLVCCHRTRLAGAGCPIGRECPYVELRAHRSFTTKWSEEDGAFVGLCDQFPSMSCLDADEGKALAGIMGLVAGVESEGS